MAASQQALGAATRAARSSPALPFAWAASAADVPPQELSNALRDLRRHGRCDSLAADAFINSTAARRAAMLASRWCPPGLKRLAAVDTTAADRPNAAAGTPGWDGRDLRSSAAPRGRIAAAAGAAYSQLRSVAASHPFCPPAVLLGAAQDPDEWVRVQAARCESCPPAAIMLLATDDSWEVTETLAERPDLDSAVLAALAGGSIAESTLDKIGRQPQL